ncbi:MAG: ABC transporter ATP-binding protein [Candidatus Dormibacteraeota bacterium]|uniref:ABC transporter ATP-binding protein n=1 Tax=Candidatus Dormiibacter inghamiae TaxID=3127013 RepID=A0A934KFE7_9BACT|nr:ABC transporter ATP-binding protein [Candidatus Dormibacteraeota bacterium]MBJ7607232.1 ABC transporter ATP-binding protein [Candidatus Dormibacteraeota bacterium]
MIQLLDVAYRYPGEREWAIRETSLAVKAGELVGIRGANESGKTTLCLVAAGLAPRVLGGELRGSVELAGLSAILFDNPETQLSGLCRTVYEEVAFGPCNLGLARQEVHLRTAAALERMGIGQLAGKSPERLSAGQTQLVVLAGLMALQPDALILDEPVSRLDPDGADVIAGVLLGLADSGKAVLLAEHDEALLSLCGRVVEL